MGRRQVRLGAVVAASVLVAVVTAVLAAVLLMGGPGREMSWGEKISRRESYLYIDGETLTNDDLSYIASLHRLRVLELRNCNVAECNLRDLDFATKELYRASFAGTTGLWDLSFLSRLPAATLDLTGCATLDDAALAQLNWEVLEDLTIDGTNVSDLAPVAGSALDRISFAHTEVSDLAPLAQLDSLWEVNGSYTKVRSLDELAVCDSLWGLAFDGCPIRTVRTDFASDYLRELSLANTRVKNLDGFAACTELRELDLGGCARLTGMGWLNAHCRMTLRSLDLGMTGLEADDLRWLPSCTSLEELTLDGIALDDLDLCSNLSGLTFVSAVGCGLTDVSGLRNCPALKNVLLGYNQLSDLRALPDPDGEGYPAVTVDLSHNGLTSLATLPAGAYRCLLLHGNEEGVASTLPAGVSAYDVTADWSSDVTTSGLEDYDRFTYVYLVDSPPEAISALDDAFRSWRLARVDTDELLTLLEDDNLGYSLYCDMSGYVAYARSHQ